MPTDRYSAETIAILRDAVDRGELIFEQGWQAAPETLTLSPADLRMLVMDGLILGEFQGQLAGYRPTPLLRSALNGRDDS